MENSDNDDIFEDFGNKVEGKKETPKFNDHVEKKHYQVNNEDMLKSKYKEEQQALKEKFKKEAAALEHRKARDFLNHGKIPSKNLAGIERITYIVIIVILLGYLIFDLSSSDDGSTIEIDTKQTITATVVKEVENITNVTEVKVEEIVEEVNKSEEVKEVEVKLSGRIIFSIDKIYTEKDENIGEINKISFTIDNGVDDVLTPIINVFAYDDENKEYYETRSRGQYTFPAGIAPGIIHKATIELSPKKFSNLNLEKTIRLTLNDTKDGFIKSVTDEVTIS